MEGWFGVEYFIYIYIIYNIYINNYYGIFSMLQFQLKHWNVKRFEAFSKGDIWLSASPVLLQYDSSVSPVV